MQRLCLHKPCQMSRWKHEAISSQVAESWYGSLKLSSQRVKELQGETPEVPALVRFVRCCGLQGRAGEMTGESWQTLLIEIAGLQKMGKRPARQKQGDRRSPDGWRTMDATER